MGPAAVDGQPEPGLHPKQVSGRAQAGSAGKATCLLQLLFTEQTLR